MSDNDTSDNIASRNENNDGSNDTNQQTATNAEGETRQNHHEVRRRDTFPSFPDVETMMDRMLGHRWPLFRAFPSFASTQEGWAPQIDMYEKDHNLVVKAELPGIDKDDIDVSLDQGDLVIRGERRSEHEDTGENNYYRMERSYGAFYRRIPMPEGVQEDDISATYNDGVLEITAPLGKTEIEKAKKITVK